MEEVFMLEALKQAKKSFNLGEVPVGAVIVKNEKIIARAYNQIEQKKDATSHAEILVIKKAEKILGDWRLNECELYVTLEPCSMCSGAIINSRIKKVVFGAYDKNIGCAGSTINLFTTSQLHFKGEIVGGVLEHESLKLLQDFFKDKRNKSRKN